MKKRISYFKYAILLNFLLICLFTVLSANKNANAACIQNSDGGQCVEYVRDYFGGSYELMPGLCQYNPDCGAYNAWGHWDLGFGSGPIPKDNSIMVLDQFNGLTTGHMAVVTSISSISGGTYTLNVHESNWDLDDELVDCDVIYIYYADDSEVTRETGTTRYPVLGFIYGLRIWDAYLWRSNRGPNSIGWTEWDRLVMSCHVDPITSAYGDTTVVAENPDTGDSLTLSYIGGYAPYEFGRSLAYDPVKTGVWVIAATNGPHTVEATTPAIGDVEQIPFLRNVQLIGSGLTPTISWTVPPGTGADRVNISVIDGATGIRLWRGPNLGLETIKYTIPEGVLQPNYPYVIRARLQDTFSGTISGPDKSRSESFFNFTPLEEGEPAAVFLPTLGPDPDPTDEFGASYVFDIDVEEGVPCFIDPFVAVGYDYAIGAEDTVKFASVALPEIGDNLFDLYLFNGSSSYLAQKDLEAGETFIFGPDGVELFRVLGIEEEAELDPLDVTAFITELTFTGTGQFTGTMTPIVAFVPELPNITVNTEKVKVYWDKSKIKVEGKLYFPEGVWMDTVSPFGSAVITLAEVKVADQSIEFEIKGKKNDKWEYKDKKNLYGNIKEFKIDWKREGYAKFKLVSIFDSELFPEGSESSPDELEYVISLGQMISGSDLIGVEKVWTKKEDKHWEYK